MKRIVLLAASAAVLVQFTKNDLTALQTLGCEIHMVCDLQQPAVSAAALHAFNQTFPKLIWHDIPFSDNALSLLQNHRAKQALTALLEELKPDLLHCHGTIAGIYGRSVAEKLGIPVFYTAHDFRVFHGCHGAERLVFAPLERRHSRHTQVMLTVCPEDAAYAKKCLHAAQVVDLPDVMRVPGGVGVHDLCADPYDPVAVSAVPLFLGADGGGRDGVFCGQL